MICCYLFSSQAETTLLNQQLNERLLESTDGFHDDQQQIQVCYDNQLLVFQTSVEISKILHIGVGTVYDNDKLAQGNMSFGMLK